MEILRRLRFTWALLCFGVALLCLLGALGSYNPHPGTALVWALAAVVAALAPYFSGPATTVGGLITAGGLFVAGALMAAG